MTLHVDLTAALAERLAILAKGTSRTPEQVALAAIERELTAWDRKDASLEPVGAAFEASGMSEDELSDLLEAEKHAMRRERSGADARAKQP
jgi:predicted transcriptional regulator